MTDLEDHIRFEALVADALRAPDPAVALAGLADDPRMPEPFRETVRAIDPDGVRVSGLLSARLRFERLVHGSRHAAEWFEDDTAAFAKSFRDYHEQVPPTASLPAAEARLFEAWLAQRKTES